MSRSKRLIRADRPKIGVDLERLSDSQQSPFRPFLRRSIIEFREPHRTHQRRICPQRQFARLIGKWTACALDSNSSQKAFIQGQRVIRSGCHGFQNFDGFARDFHADPVSGEDQDVQIHRMKVSLLGDRRSASDHVFHEVHDLVIAQTLLVVRQVGKAMVDLVQLIF